MKDKLLYCPVCKEFRNHKLIDGKYICYLCDNVQVIIPVAEKRNRDILLEQAGMTEDELAWLG